MDRLNAIIAPSRSQFAVIAIVVVALITGFLIGRRGATPTSAPADAHRHESRTSETAKWTCAMHPQIQLPEPGACPICGMDLIPLDTGAVADGEWALEMTDAARKLAEIVTAPVAHLQVTQEVRMAGKVEYDETRLKTVSARFGGRLDRLFVDYTGVTVRKGDHLVWLYSPELYAAQEELLEAKKRVQHGARERSEFLRASNLRALESAREKLRLWGLGNAQIEALESRGTAESRMTITSPVGGIVANMWVKEGDYVETGAKIYTVADLEHVWVKLDAYESNLMWLRYGQEVSIEAEAYPGRTFPGRVSFIDPVLDERTRTVKVRVNVDNEDGRLKPGMFVRAVVRATIAEGGKVMDPGLAGKWIGPMHPEVVRDGPGRCPVCGMKLRRAEDLGLVSSDETDFQSLVVPVSAVLRTGKRAVVYVERPHTRRPTYEGRLVTLGPRAGDRYIVTEGLTAGERVVINGNFKIDSALQIQARPSMMAPPHTEAHTRPATRPAAQPGTQPATRPNAPLAAVPQDAADGLRPIYDGYFELHEALAADDLRRSRAAFVELTSAIARFDSSKLSTRQTDLWHSYSTELRSATELGGAADGIDGARAALSAASAAILAIDRDLGHPGKAPHFEAHCPMAFDGKGGSWLQRDEPILNPYYGEAMLFCGTVTARHPGIAEPQ